MANDYMSANSYFGLGLEPTRGTAASVSTYTPISTPKVEPKLTWLNDEAFRASPVMNYDQVPGVRHDEFSGKVYLYSDVYPQLLRGVLGGPDSVASVAGGSTHTIGLYNAASAGSQPPSYTVINNSVDGTYQLTGSQFSDISVAFGADAAVETTFLLLGNPASVVANPTVNPTSQHLVPGWNVSASVGGAAVAVVESGTLEIKRNTTSIHTLGSQAPHVNFAGPIEVSGKLEVLIESGSTFFANALARQQQQILLQMTDPVTGFYVYFQMSAAQLENPTIDQSKAYIALSTNFVAVANTTDATSGGYSPILTKTFNGISTAY